MTQQYINIGTVANDGTGDVMRDAFTKVDNNFSELYSTSANLTSNISDLSNNVNTYVNTLYIQVGQSNDLSNTAILDAGYAANTANATKAIANTVNSAWNLANSAYDYANGTVVRTNSIYALTNSSYNVANAAFAFANSLPLGGAIINAAAAFDQANLAFQLAGEAFDLANVDYNLAISGIANAASAYNFANGVSANTTSAYRVVNSSYTVANSAYNTTNAVYYLANASFDKTNAAFSTANTKVNTVNGICTGTFTVQGSLSVQGSSSFAGYHTIDSSGAIFRTSGAGYGIRIYAPNGSGSGILQFTDSFQSVQWGTIYASNTELGVVSSINVPVRVKVNGSTVGSFSSSGMTITGQIWATDNITAYYSSDIKLKENIVIIDNALDKVKQIRGVFYDWSDDYIKSHGGEDGYFVRKHDVGVIAQEVEKVLPEIVADREDGTKAVRYEKIIPLLVEAIKELSDEVERLKNASSK